MVDPQKEPSENRGSIQKNHRGHPIAETAASGRFSPGEAAPAKTPPSALLNRLKELFPDSSSSSIKEWLRLGRVRVNGAVQTDPRKIVNHEAEIELGQKAVVAPVRSGHAISIPILYRDPHIVIIDKPAGLLSVAAAYEKEHCARALLQSQLRGDVLAVHRLDRDTSGVLCFARSTAAQQRLKNLFAAHDLRRQYLAVVDGHLEEKEGTWSSWIWEDPVSYQVRLASPEKEGAQLAVTHYRVLREGPERSLLELTLETGRKHQIRVHCAAAGAPVTGDPRYGHAGPRLALHAQWLELQHPLFHEMVSAHAPAPDFFKRAVNQRI